MFSELSVLVIVTLVAVNVVYDSLPFYDFLLTTRAETELHK